MIPIYDLGVVPSTNVHARHRLDNGLNRPVVLWARAQTAGLGQPGKTFDSPVSGLYASWVLPAPDPVPADLTMRWARYLAAILRPEIAPEDHRELNIVPINDLFMDEKKVGGILVEKYRERLIVGLGLNVLPREFPPDLADKATTFYLDERDHLEVRRLLDVLNRQISSDFRDEMRAL